MTCFRPALLVLLSLSACNVGSVEQAASAIAKNECRTGGDCAAGDCVGGQCLSHEGKLQTVLFEVTPPSDTLGGAQFLSTVALQSQDQDIALNIDPVAPALGEVLVVNRKCVPEFDLATAKGGSIPAVLTLSPSTSVLGLYSPRTVVQSALINETYFGFSLSVPPGQYDIYVEPKHQPNDLCPVPPALLRGQTISAGSLSIKLPEPSTFEFHVTWLPADGALNGWTADMLDPHSGRVISNRVSLSLVGKGKTDYVANLYYLPVVSNTAEAPAQELVRLSPPVNLTAPTVLLVRSALGLVTPNQGVLTQFTGLPNSVHVQGQVTQMSTPTPAAAAVTLVATQISGVDPGVLASFVRTVNVNQTGDFQVDLLPGTYRVSAIPSAGLQIDPNAPSDSKLAAVNVNWEVADAPAIQAGRVIELGQASVVTGDAFSGNTALATAQVSAVASPASIKMDVLQQLLGEAVPVPRASTGFVGATGNFTLDTDVGSFDIAVKPLSNTGFAWLVLPSVQVGNTPANLPGFTLGHQEAPPPVRYHGTVSLPGVPVNGALVRAYVYMSGGAYTADASQADSVLQVAETRTGDKGNFDAYIPAALNSWDPTLAR